MRKTIHRSAKTGRLVTKEYAEANPDTTVKETLHDHQDLLLDFLTEQFPEMPVTERARRVTEYLND